MIGTSKFNFVFSAMTDMNIKSYTPYICGELDKLFINNLLMKNYTKSQTELALIFMAIAPSTHSFRPDRKFNRRKFKSFDMYMNVPDYDKFRTATKPEAKKIIAELYLTGIKKYLSKQKDFNHELFYKDVKELFQKEGII